MTINPRLLDSDLYRYSFDMPSRFSDVDLQNHLNNTRISEFYQESRVRFFKQLERENNLQRSHGMRFLVAHTAIDYLAEVNYPQPITMKLAVAKIGRTSLTLRMALFSESRCAGLAKVVVVMADAQGPIPVPDDWRTALDRHQLPADMLEP